jgi:hypothetical protein
LVSGDPKIEDLIYHLDTRSFEYDGKPDLSVVHVRCGLSNLMDGPGYPICGESISARVPPVLHETDFETYLNVIFQISQWPTIQDGDKTGSELTNLDFMWTNLPDKNMSEDEIE